LVPIQFLNLIIKRSALDRVYSGGSSAFISENGPFDGKINAYDEHLVKFGTTDSSDIGSIAGRIEAIGLIGITKDEDKSVWTDYCVIEEAMGPTLRCDWIEYDWKKAEAAFALNE